jgi:hypothetical protein
MMTMMTMMMMIRIRRGEGWAGRIISEARDRSLLACTAYVCPDTSGNQRMSILCVAPDRYVAARITATCLLILSRAIL